MRISAADAVTASLFVAASLAPSLYPRPAIVQGILTGIALATGRLAVRLFAAVAAPDERPTTPVRSHRWLRTGAWSVALLVVIAAVVVNYRWQSDVRTLMAIAGHPLPYLLKALLTAAATAYGVTLAGRAALIAPRGYARLVARGIPSPWRFGVHAIVAALLAVVIVDVVIAGHLVRVVNERLMAAHAEFPPEAPQPAAATLSGAPGSLVPWTSLGRMGRAFVAAAPTAAELADFNGARATQPVRAYVGLDSAPTVRARVDLAMAELDRAGAFDRDVLVVVIPTGTGGVNRHAIAPLEYMYNGNTATVAVQYSYLPSWVVMAGDQDRAARTARMLFATVEQRLARQPKAQRPRLLVYGESLGSFGGEQVFDGLGDLRHRVDGALWVGPPRANGLWRHLTTNRDPRSPVWRPVYRAGEAVRFGARGADLLEPSGAWNPPRVVYLQHGSDPVTWWSPQLLFQRPEWLTAARPPDISPRMPYVPVVTFLQTTIDTILGGSAPMHFGHIYGTEQAEAWAAIASPPQWSSDDTRRLGAALEE